MTALIAEKSSLQEKIRHDCDLVESLMENAMDDVDEETREYVIKAAMKRYLEQGMTPTAARAVVEEALDAPCAFTLPSFDDL